ncbi:hypothetical protein AWB75_06863 [Caballeronia catudaia]|uniref:Uncharacterized protein n=1 Tax=Caballeronia catudaia TaxID=1777136 RepID=A0A158DJV3_9BURK|nr:hypothetical protein AWB75_06863 [Caballeronia catudaia]
MTAARMPRNSWRHASKSKPSVRYVAGSPAPWMPATVLRGGATATIPCVAEPSGVVKPELASHCLFQLTIVRQIAFADVLASRDSYGQRACQRVDCAAVFDKPTILRIYLPNAGRLMGRRLMIGSEDLGWIAGRVSPSEEHRVAALAVAQGDAAPHRPTSCLTPRMLRYAISPLQSSSLSDHFLRTRMMVCRETPYCRASSVTVRPLESARTTASC